MPKRYNNPSDDIIKDYKKHIKSAARSVKSLQPKIKRSYLAIAHFDFPNSTKRKIKFGQATIIPQMLLHNQICRNIVEEHGGNVIKELGDAVLATFNNAGIACECALNVIYNLRRYNKNIETKIAISTGIVERITIHQKKDVFGVAVDLCDRIAKHATPHSVLVHETVYRDVETLLKGQRYVNLGRSITKSLKDFNKTKLHKITLQKNIRLKNKRKKASRKTSKRKSKRRIPRRKTRKSRR